MFIRVFVRLLLVMLTVVVAACGGGGSQSQPEGGAPAASAPATPPPAPIGASTITGTVKLEGTPPEARVIRMSSDPLCMPEGPSLSEVVLVGPDNGLQNVFVYVKDGLGDRAFQAPQTPVVLDQQGCKYMPHVFGVQVGQPVLIKNSDGTLHNVHAVPKLNTEFNFGQPLKGMETTRTFDKPEVMVPFRCDVHGWMAAYGGIVPHPFFAVTANNGSFEIKGLPAGTYTIETWHERFGLQTQTVTVDGTAAGKADFTYKAGATS
jgi:plastocyanin